jgi:uncharacterized protein YbjT (DUF2867 family)
VDALHAAGHDAVVIARSTGVDVSTGAGLDAALEGADAVIDVINSPATEAEEARTFFGTAASNLVAAEQRVGVAHHVLLSIVGIERAAGNAHYAGKIRQEEIVAAGPVPYTIVRATQFFEFAEMVVDWTTKDDRAAIPPLLVQPAAAADVAAELVQTALKDPLQRTVEVAGPETQDLVDMARRALIAHGKTVTLVPTWRDGPFGTAMAGDVLLPAAAAILTPTTFDQWLDDTRVRS